jgi:hypothetical protein
MVSKKIITVFLILVLMIQLLPVKQVVRYFFVDNPASEELVEAGKAATKNFRLLDEDHKWVADDCHIFSADFTASTSSFFHFAEALPALFSKDIQTPPPNRA